MQLTPSFLLFMMFTSPIFNTTVYTSAQKVHKFPAQKAESPSPSSSSPTSSTSSTLSSSSIWNSGSNRTCLPRKFINRNITSSRIVMNVTRAVDGDFVVVPCRGRCGELCSNIGAVRIRCDLRDWPCKCKCASGTTFRTDTARCVNTFNECSSLRASESRRSSSDVMLLESPLSSSPTSSSSTSSPSSSSSFLSSFHSNSQSTSPSSLPTTNTDSTINREDTDSSSINGKSIDHAERAKSHSCTITHAYHPSEGTNQKDDIEMNITALPWQLSIAVANHSLSIKWTNTTGAERLKGSIVQINYSCCIHDVLLPPCLVFKIAGSRYYSVATDVLRQSKSTPPTAGNRLGVSSGGESMTSMFNTSATPGAPAEFVTSNNTNTTTADGMTAYEERLEVIVTGLCIGVAILLAFWLACFLIEKRSQSKYMKRGSDKQNVSQTRQYPHEVATVRKTLMEIYDMPMIRVAQSDEEESESGSGQSTGSRGGRARLESEGDEQNSSTNISSSDQPTGADSSSSEDTLRKKEKKEKKKTTFADPKVHLDVPKEGTPEKFGQWRPVAKIGSPGEVRSNRFIAVSPPAHPKRTLAGGRSPSILKKPSNFNANKSPPSILRFSRGRKMRDNPTTIEMNSMGDHLNHGYTSPKKHMKLVSALKTSDSRKHKRTRFKMDEPDDIERNCAGAGADTTVLPVGNKAIPKQLVTCEVHFETPAAPLVNGELEAEEELDDDDDEEVTERTPLKKNVNFVVVEKGLASKCKFNLSWEDTDGLPCTDV